MNLMDSLMRRLQTITNGEGSQKKVSAGGELYPI
jgi:hypothetical protein